MSLVLTFCCRTSISDDMGEIARIPYSCLNRFRRLYHVSLIPSRPSWSFSRYVHLGIALSEHFCHSKLHLESRTSPFAQNSRLLACASRVTSEESEEYLSGESVILDEQTLRRDLQIAIDEENYAQAAKIRDSLRVLEEDSNASLLAANTRFYNAFRKGDLAAMEALWAKAKNVCCVHPGASGVLGYDDVMESWEVVWLNYDFPLEIELKSVRVHFRGDVGYVTCVEFIKTKGRSWGAQFVTNVFEKIDGHWFISVHHASPVDL